MQKKKFNIKNIEKKERFYIKMYKENQYKKKERKKEFIISRIQKKKDFISKI